MAVIRKAIGAKTLDPKLLTAAEKLQYEGYQRRQQTNQMVRQLANDGTPIRCIVRLTGLSRGLVRQIVRGEREDVFRIRESSLTLWLPQLEREWAGGCRNGAGCRRVDSTAAVVLSGNGPHASAALSRPYHQAQQSRRPPAGLCAC